MKTITKLRTTSLVMIIAVALAYFVVPVYAATSGTDTRPNIIVLMTDDQDIYSMSKFPKIQSLIVEQGITFENNIVTYSKCCPSRATFVTGQYPHNTGVEANSLPLGSYAKMGNNNTLALWLQKSGYYTGHIGKYLNGYGQLDTNLSDNLAEWQEIPAGYSEWYGTIDPSTYKYYNYSMNENGVLVQYGYTPADYQTNVISNKADDFIRRRASSTDGKPFFLIITPLAPHHDDVPPLGPEPAPNYKGYFANEPLPRPPGFNEADMSDKPLFMQHLPSLNTNRIQDITTWYRKRLETLLSVDDMVAGTIDTLNKTGQLNNTVIIFTSDNGWIQGEHRVPYGKEFAYEPSIRVPLVIRGPGIPKGKAVTNLVANIDLAPTIVELSGATPQRTMDGVSLVPLFKGEALSQRSGIEVECRGLFGLSGGDAEGGMAAENGLPSLDFYAIRTSRYTYVQYSSGAEELYDLNLDPYELHNVEKSSYYAYIKNALNTKLNALKSCSGSSCLI